MNVLRPIPVARYATPMARVPQRFGNQTLRSEHGATLAEFSIGVMLLVLTTFGIADFGRALYAYHFVSLVSHQATRWAMVRGSQCKEFPTACPASSTDIANYVASLAPGGIDTTQLTVTATCGTPGTPGNQGPCTPPNDNPGQVVNVLVQYKFSFLYGFASSLGATMSSSSQMIIWQ